MSYKLNTVVDFMDGNGLIITDEDLLTESLNSGMGLNLYHDLVITAHEVNKIRNALVSLQILALSNENEFLKKLTLDAMESIG